jgi:hypothetical protein
LCRFSVTSLATTSGQPCWFTGDVSMGTNTSCEMAASVSRGFSPISPWMVCRNRGGGEVRDLASICGWLLFASCSAIDTLLRGLRWYSAVVCGEGELLNVSVYARS